MVLVLPALLAGSSGGVGTQRWLFCFIACSWAVVAALCVDSGMWRQFTGDEVGIILAAYMANVRASQGISKDEMLFVCSVVSSKMLKAFAEASRITAPVAPPPTAMRLASYIH